MLDAGQLVLALRPHLIHRAVLVRVCGQLGRLRQFLEIRDGVMIRLERQVGRQCQKAHPAGHVYGMLI